jgi:hypothetical protein
MLSAGALVALLAVLFSFNVAGLRDRLLYRGTVLPKIESIAVLPWRIFPVIRNRSTSPLA